MNGRAGFPDLYVMDSLADDTEDLEGILRMLNRDMVLGCHEEWGRSSNVLKLLRRSPG
jgi:hypothetical protein